MTLASSIRRWLQRDCVNFTLTNRIPRRLLTRFIGWYSRIEHPWVCRLSIAIWRWFAQPDLCEAKKDRFRSLQDCFIRELKEGARTIDTDRNVVVSPCDALVGATGRIEDGTVLQAKGNPYPLIELLQDPELSRYYLGGWYTTLRLTAGMYHRFHAPYTCRVEQVTYVGGDVWNVNPIALTKVDRLFCRNERATIRCRLLPSDQLLTLVPIGAILVGSIRLHFLDLLLHLNYQGPEVIPCDRELHKGEEMGWFQQGSTIIVLAPRTFGLCGGISHAQRLLMGQPLFRL